MTLSKKTKLIGLAVVLTIILATVAVIAYIAVKRQRPAINLDLVFKLYDMGNYDEAKPLLEEAITMDPVNERAYVCLARIAQKEGIPSTEAKYWQIATKLNPLDQNYQDEALRAYAKIRHFKGILDLIAPHGKQPDTPLTEERSFLYLLATMRMGKTPAASIYLELLKKKNQAFLDSTYGRFILALYEIPLNLEKIRPFTDAEDPIVAMEADLTMIELLAAKNDFKDMEKILVHLKDLNPYSGNPRLAGFYMQTCQFKKAIEIYQEDLKRFNRISSAVYMAEACFMTGKADSLKSFQNTFSISGKEAILVGKYVDLLVSTAEKDEAKIIQQWKDIQTEIKSLLNTQLSNLIGLFVAVKQNNSIEIQQRWYAFLAQRPYYDFPQRAQKLIYAHITKLITQNKLKEAAELLELKHIDPFDNILFTRCFLGYKINANALTLSILNQALKRYPDDLFVLQCATEFHFQKQETERSMHYVNRALKQNPPPNSGIHYFRIHNLIRMHDYEKAARGYLDLVAKLPDNVAILVECCQFCLKHEKLDALQELARTLKDGPPKRMRLIPFVNGYALLVQKKIDMAMEQFRNVQSDNPLVIFKTAAMLGTHGQAKDALRLYGKLTATNPNFDPVHTYLNMAELQSEEGQTELALATAKKAFDLAPDYDVARLVYAEKMLRLKRFEDVMEILPMAKLKDNSRLIAIWSEAAEHCIPALMQEGKTGIARKMAQDYKNLNPSSKTAGKLLNMTQPPKNMTDNERD